MRQRKNFAAERKQPEIKNRWDYFPLSIFSGLCFGVIVWIFLTVSPSTLKDILWSDSYLPLLLVIWLMFASGFTVLFLHTRRALLLSFFFCLLFWLHFQGVLDWKSAFYVAVPLLLTELILTFPWRK